LDLEGVVAKQKSAPYITEREHSTWFKILNREYSQKDAERNCLSVSGTVSRLQVGIRVQLPLWRIQRAKNRHLNAERD